MWAESAQQTTWHPHHISERYGLLTLIVLGESILAASVAIQSSLAAGGTVLGSRASRRWRLAHRVFDVVGLPRSPVHDLLTRFRKALRWGYGHYFVFGVAAGSYGWRSPF